MNTLIKDIEALSKTDAFEERIQFKHFLYDKVKDHNAVTIETLIGIAHLKKQSGRIYALDDGQIDNFEGLVGKMAAPYRSDQRIGGKVLNVDDKIEACCKIKTCEYYSGWFGATIMSINDDGHMCCNMMTEISQAE